MRMYVHEIAGKVHDKSEDAHCLMQFCDIQGNKWNLAMVADGCSGYSGTTASHLATNVVGNYVCNHISSGEDYLQLLHMAIVHANQVLFQQNSVRTTIDVALLSREMCYTAHVGDSRIYLYTSSGLEQITKDEVKFAEPANYLGVLDIEGRNIEKRVTVAKYNLQGIKGILLTTDGLSSRVTEGELQETFRCVSRDYAMPSDLLQQLDCLVRIPQSKLDALSEMRKKEVRRLLEQNGYFTGNLTEDVHRAYVDMAADVMNFVDTEFKFDDTTMVYVDVEDVVERSFDALRELRVKFLILDDDVKAKKRDISRLETRVDGYARQVSELNVMVERNDDEYRLLQSAKNIVDAENSSLTSQNGELEIKVKELEDDKEKRNKEDGPLMKLVNKIIEKW